MANEPSLGELTNISSNPELSGIAPDPVIDNRDMVNNLNANARFQAENTYRKYNQFLQNKADLYKNIEAIQSLPTMPEDRDVLYKQAGEALSDILKDPTIVMGGQGFDKLQQKITKFRGDAMLSRQNLLDNKTNLDFIAKNPDLDTPENRSQIESNIAAPLGQRKSVMLQMPTILDEKSLFESAIKSSTHPYTDDPKDGLIQTGIEIDPNAIKGQMGMALTSGKDKYNHSIENAVNTNFSKLPDEDKKAYTDLAKANGTKPLEEYWKDHTNEYLNAYFPDGSYKMVNGKYRFQTKTISDPSYLKKDRLDLDTQKAAQKATNDRESLKIRWANYNLSKKKIDDADAEDLSSADSVLNQAISTINNGTPVEVNSGKSKTSELRISDPVILDAFAKIRKDPDTDKPVIPNAINYNPKTNQGVLIYGSPNKDGGFGDSKNPVVRIPFDQGVLLSVIRDSKKTKNPDKVNMLMNEALKSSGNSLFNLSQKGKTVEAPETKASKSTSILKGNVR